MRLTLGGWTAKVLAIMNQYTANPISQEERFWAKVAILANDELCWEWRAFCNKKGYGVCRYKNRMTYAHIVAYEFFFSKVPAGLFVLRKCDNPPCCNPKHLFVGTAKDNVQDMINKGRKASLAGTLNPAAKLNIEQVQEIRKLYAAGGISYQKLAQKFEVSDSMIERIVNLKNWI